MTNAPRLGRGEILQPLPGCVSLFLFYPGVRFAHPRLSSLRPAGAQLGTTELVPSHSERLSFALAEDHGNSVACHRRCSFAGLPSATRKMALLFSA